MSFLGRLKFRALSGMFPEVCPYCRRVISPDDYACERCRKKLPSFSYKRSAVGGALCAASLPYQKSFSSALKAFKFKGMASFARPFSVLVSGSVLEIHGSGFDVITAVPMFEKKQKKRGYNQSELLGRECSKLLNVPYEPLLEKFRDNKPQHSLPRREREKNVHGVFRVFDKEAVKGKRILLIDDVITTGNTLGECVRILKKSGAKTVACAALCTTMM